MCPIDSLEESGGIGLRSFHGIPPSAYITAHESRWCDGILRLFFLLAFSRKKKYIEIVGNFCTNIKRDLLFGRMLALTFATHLMHSLA